MTDTIFAVSSGAAPAAIAIIRISGPEAFAAGRALAGNLPPPRRAGLRALHDGDVLLDHALVLAFSGPGTATGEDLLEFHCHGGRAIVRAVEAALARRPGLRLALPGEFTRRGLANGRIDLAQAEGLADLIAAETEGARRAALAAADGAVSRAAGEWARRLIALSARIEVLIDFADEDDVAAAPDAVAALMREIGALQRELADAASRPPVERLRDGIRVVLAGPPNSGKSSLLNALAEREVAIATPIAGTTRDRIEHAVVRGGRSYILTDVAGLRDATDDPVEAIGIARAREAMAAADLVLWLGDDPAPQDGMIAIHARADLPERSHSHERLAVSAITGTGIETLWQVIGSHTDALLPRLDETAFNQRQRSQIAAAAVALAEHGDDLILTAEHLRVARLAIGSVSGGHDVEPLLDALFSRFCIGK